MTTSGTTGRPLRRVFSARDWRYPVERFLRQPGGGLGPGDATVNLGPIDGLMEPMISVDTAAARGVLAVCAVLYESRGRLKLIEDLRPASVSGTVSYLLYLGELARQEGVDLPALGICTLSCAGEPGVAIAATRERLMALRGASYVHDGYGMTESFPLGGSCARSASFHIPDDLALVAVVDLETGEAVPRGEPGELVYTNLIGDMQPLLRYRSRDMGRLAPAEPCVCGCTRTRVQGLEGRVDDMV